MSGAADTYRGRLAEVRAQIRRLAGLLLIHERRANAKPADWGYAGDLAFIAERLTETTNVIALDPKRRCEWEGCATRATMCIPDNRAVCGDHAIESDSDPRECLDLVDGSPVDSD
jgi:hypothetical protein